MPATILAASVLLGLALAATCGLRVFLPLLGACMAAKFHLIPIQDDFRWLGGTTALICLAPAAVVEIVVCYIPRFDPVPDIIAWPLGIVAGALLSTAVLPVQAPVIRWALGLVGGGAAAGTVHAATVLLKFFSADTSPGGGRYRAATGRSGLALGGILLSIFLPTPAGVAAVILIIWLWTKLWKTFQPLRSR